MARRTWIRCKCGAKLHAKKPNKVCYVCSNKQRKGQKSHDKQKQY